MKPARMAARNAVRANIILRNQVSFMPFFLGIVIVLVLLAALVLFLLAPNRGAAARAGIFDGLNCAHRGLHSKDRTVPENSLPAFRAAAESGYGIELDVQLSSDEAVVVFHDDTLDRVCGVHGRVDAFSLEELRSMRLCGTQEGIPLFTEVLETVAGRSPLIVELKTGPRNDLLCRKTLDILRAYDGPFCIESFDPRIVAWFRRNAPDIARGQLSDSPANFKEDGQSALRSFVLGGVWLNVIARPDFIAYGPGRKPLSVRIAEALGAFRVRWTVRPEDEPAAREKENDCVIFEFYRPEPRFH